MSLYFWPAERLTTWMQRIFLCVFLLLAAHISAADYGHFQLQIRRPGSEANLSGAVMIVNNTLVQPADLGHKIILGGRVASYPSLDHQLAGRSLCWRMMSALEENDPTATPQIMDKTTNTGTNFYKRTLLSRSQLDSLCTLYQADALIVLNQVVCQSQTEAFASDEFSYYAYLQMHLSTHWTIYQHGQTERQIALHDTLLWENEANSMERAIEHLPAREEALPAMLDVVSQRMTTRLFTHWETADRYIYISKNEAMQQAQQHFTQNHWQQAIECWLRVYQEITKKKKQRSLQAQAAANIAIAYELQDQLSVALEWAQAANRKWGEVDSAEADQEKANVREYINQLKKRIAEQPTILHQ